MLDVVIENETHSSEQILPDNRIYRQLQTISEQTAESRVLIAHERMPWTSKAGSGAEPVPRPDGLIGIRRQVSGRERD